MSVKEYLNLDHEIKDNKSVRVFVSNFIRNYGADKESLLLLFNFLINNGIREKSYSFVGFLFYLNKFECDIRKYITSKYLNPYDVESLHIKNEYKVFMKICERVLTKNELQEYLDLFNVTLLNFEVYCIDNIKALFKYSQLDNSNKDIANKNFEMVREYSRRFISGQNVESNYKKSDSYRYKCYIDKIKLFVESKINYIPNTKYSGYLEKLQREDEQLYNDFISKKSKHVVEVSETIIDKNESLALLVVQKYRDSVSKNIPFDLLDIIIICKGRSFKKIYDIILREASASEPFLEIREMFYKLFRINLKYVFENYATLDIPFNYKINTNYKGMEISASYFEYKDEINEFFNRNNLFLNSFFINCYLERIINRIIQERDSLHYNIKNEVSRLNDKNVTHRKLSYDKTDKLFGYILEYCDNYNWDIESLSEIYNKYYNTSYIAFLEMMIEYLEYKFMTTEDKVFCTKKNLVARHLAATKFDYKMAYVFTGNKLLLENNLSVTNSDLYKICDLARKENVEYIKLLFEKYGIIIKDECGIISINESRFNKLINYVENILFNKFLYAKASNKEKIKQHIITKFNRVKKNVYKEAKKYCEENSDNFEEVRNNSYFTQLNNYLELSDEVYDNSLGRDTNSIAAKKIVDCFGYNYNDVTLAASFKCDYEATSIKYIASLLYNFVVDSMSSGYVVMADDVFKIIYSVNPYITYSQLNLYFMRYNDEDSDVEVINFIKNLLINIKNSRGIIDENYLRNNNDAIEYFKNMKKIDYAALVAIKKRNEVSKYGKN